MNVLAKDLGRKKLAIMRDVGILRDVGAIRTTIVKEDGVKRVVFVKPVASQSNFVCNIKKKRPSLPRDVSSVSSESS